MLVMVIFLSTMACRADSLSNFPSFNFPDSLPKFLDSLSDYPGFNFPDSLPKFPDSLSDYPGFNPTTSVLDNLINFVDTRNKNKKIGTDELELLGDEFSAKVIENLDQDGDNEVSKDELLNMAKKIIDENYINNFDLDNDGALSEDEFMGKTLDVGGAIKSVQTLGKILFDISGENLNKLFSSENLDGSITSKQDNKDARILKLLKTALDTNNDNNITKEEVLEFASTAIKVSDINKDRKITEEELFRTLEQNNISKKMVDSIRQYSQNQDKTKAWKELFHKIDVKNTKDGKLYADEISQLLNMPLLNMLEFIPIGQRLYMILDKQEFPINADEWYGGVETFLKRVWWNGLFLKKEFKQLGLTSASTITPSPTITSTIKSSSTIKPIGLTSTSAITKVNVMLVITLASTFGFIM